MKETVSVNGLTLCHKNSDGWVRSTLPDVCKSPTYPAPYTNVAFARDLADGTKTVRSHGGAMNGIKGSRFATSIGDEPGTGGGVISGVNKSEATWLSWSPNVFMEGKPVTRLTDKMLMNRGNTVSAGGYYTGPVMGPDRAILERLCEIACACKGNGNQRCVELALMASNPDPKNGLWPEVNFGYDGNPTWNADGTPSRQRFIPKTDASRLDVTQLVNGKATTIVEMKFKDDSYRGDQLIRLRKITKAAGIPLQELNVEKQCDCKDKEKEKQPEPVTAPQTQKQEELQDNRSFSERHPYWTGLGVAGLIGLAGAATWYAGGAGGAAVGAALLGGAAATQ